MEGENEGRGRGRVNCAVGRERRKSAESAFPIGAIAQNFVYALKNIARNDFAEKKKIFSL